MTRMLVAGTRMQDCVRAMVAPSEGREHMDPHTSESPPTGYSSLGALLRAIFPSDYAHSWPTRVTHSENSAFSFK